MAQKSYSNVNKAEIKNISIHRTGNAL